VRTFLPAVGRFAVADRSTGGSASMFLAIFRRDSGRRFYGFMLRDSLRRLGNSGKIGRRRNALHVSAVVRNKNFRDACSGVSGILPFALECFSMYVSERGFGLGD